MKSSQSVGTTVTGAETIDVKLPNGKQAQVALLTPESDRPLAVVDLSVLKRLAGLLPQAEFHQIKQETIDTIFATRNLEELVAVMEDEIAFHNSVNLITEVKITKEAQPLVTVH